MKRISFIIGFFSLLLFACSGEEKEGKGSSSKAASKAKKFSIEISPEQSRYNLGDSIQFSINALIENSEWDSVQFFIAEKDTATLNFKVNSVAWQSHNSKVGKILIKAHVFRKDSIIEIVSANLVMLADRETKNYEYELVKKYRHDKSAFTQGLFYHEGYLYEGTGMNGASQLRKVELETGLVTKKIDLNSALFGEGITYHDGSIFQLTWKSGLAIVYDFETFNEKTRFHYQGDGWGISSDGEVLYMSDGSHNIHIIDPLTFNKLGKIQAYDNKQSIGFINELEIIEGKLFANVWQKDFILIIEPGTGVIEGKINLNNLFPANENKPGVLNGIAYHPERKTIFLTGKNWPYLYEIKLKGFPTSS